jgi:tRNA dimethylallyltransferase
MNNDLLIQLRQFQEKPSERQKIIIVYGPTASGKTRLSLDIAHILKSEVLSVDARQIYRKMNI